MSRIDAFVDWLCIVTFPLVVLAVYYTGDTAWLRFLAMLCVIFTFTDAARDRLLARRKAPTVTRHGRDTTTDGAA